MDSPIRVWSGVAPIKFVAKISRALMLNEEWIEGYVSVELPNLKKVLVCS